MDGSKRIVVIIVAMFLVTQLIGLVILSIYSPKEVLIQDSDGNMTNSTSYNLPYGFDKPATSSPQSSLFSILIALVFAIFLMFFFMKYHFESIIRIWFFIVVVIATSLTFNAIIT